MQPIVVYELYTKLDNATYCCPWTFYNTGQYNLLFMISIWYWTMQLLSINSLWSQWNDRLRNLVFITLVEHDEWAMISIELDYLTYCFIISLFDISISFLIFKYTYNAPSHLT